MRSICPLIANQDDPTPVLFGIPAEGTLDNSFWIFELDGEGTILHSSPHPGDLCDPTMSAALGKNFFEDVSGVGDPNELKREFRAFVSGRKATETFHVVGHPRKSGTNLKVVFTKSFEIGGPEPHQTVMMEIKSEPIIKNLGGKNGSV
ncbi:MAG: hypothetical protein QUS14_12965 [Pyrinomonadaceae bacterium]|nr:hypothetical protein [Pyrinomonadaceae bacterium]